MTDNQYIYLNSIAYIANQFQNRTVDFHKLFKILYFAEQKHLVKYGSRLIDDTFVAMNNGPVPSALYDLLKGLKNSPFIFPEELKDSLLVKGRYVTSLTEVDMDWLSESEIACLNESIAENKDLNFNQLTEKSHDIAWQSDKRMQVHKIAEAGGAHEDMITYIKSNLEKTMY